MWLLDELQVPYDVDVHHRNPTTKLSPAAADLLHPLGKFPIVSVASPRLPKPIVLAESAFIAQYMTEHFGGAKKLAPTRWKEGQEGKVGGETESWMRYQYLLYYVEGSYMFTMLIYFILSMLKGANVPFLIRPVTTFIANKLIGVMVSENAKKHFAMLEGLLETAPDDGGYLCGPHLTRADILFAYPLQSGLELKAFDDMATWEKGSFGDQFPKLQAYIQRISKEPGWQRTVAKITDLDGKFSLVP